MVVVTMAQRAFAVFCFLEALMDWSLLRGFGARGRVAGFDPRLRDVTHET